MAEYIEREATCKDCLHYEVCADPCTKYRYRVPCRKFVNAADVVEARHGVWIEDGYAEKPCVCSYCGAEAQYTSTFNETFEYDWEENLQSTGYEEIREYIKTPYCSQCGAKMDGVPDTNVGNTTDGNGDVVTCLNCKHLMFSDMYGECNKQLRIVNPSDTCEYAEPKYGKGDGE